MKSDQTASAVPTAQSTASLPESLKSALSGLTEGAVTVHYNSAKPARLKAYAYAQDSVIHVGPGQQAPGVAVNEDRALELEADKLGTVAATAG
jgi:hypothetical protein